ncbi:RDD family protein [Enterococcus faecium]|uniref:RDD family protein n=1 Tax=Enterococcus faecium TaxID=1352 RepID=UPI0021A3D98A|nr:RDD family protein [Enterococcus faecium]
MKTMIASFCLSLFFELTQLSGLYFIYPRPYRLFDVNDLVTNTLGGIIGFVVTPLFTFMLPTRRRMDELSYEKGKTVSLTRRLVAYLIDWTFLSLINLVAAIFFKLAFDSGTVTSHIWWLLLEVGVYFMIVPFITNGWTLGKKIVRIRLVEEDRERISLKALMIRYGYLYFLFYGLSWLAANHEFDNEYGVADECSIHFSRCLVTARYFYFKYLAIIFEKKTDSVL